jgi:hypothetical protein
MKSASRKKMISSCVLAGFLAFGLAYAGNVSKARHPNLAAAQSFIEKAVKKVTAAQVANEYDMDGHAAKAKELLDQAYIEVKLAAEAANENRKMNENK